MKIIDTFDKINKIVQSVVYMIGDKCNTKHNHKRIIKSQKLNVEKIILKLSISFKK